MPIIDWCLRRCGQTLIVAQRADKSRMPSSGQWLKSAVELYPCDLLFVHRDAEAQPPDDRRVEIAAALRDVPVRHVPVIPVRMTEAWLLAHESAIRAAAGNPNGREPLSLPPVRRLENLPDPKALLHEVLKKASGLNARRRSKLPVYQQIHLIPKFIEDYSCLDVLPAFQLLQRDIRDACATLQSVRE
jgi:hypothetical protein